MVGLETFIDNWNTEFPDHPLKAENLTKPHQVIHALLAIYDRLGIDRDSVLSPPPESEWDSHTPYYRDMIPAINMTRVINHLVSGLPQVEASEACISHILQPTVQTSFSWLLLLFNLMVFNQFRLGAIAEDEEKLFAQQEQVKVLENRKIELLDLLNKQAEEKGKRAERLERLDEDIKQLDEQLKKEMEANEMDRKEFEIILEENRQQEILLEQKKTQKDLLLAELAKKKKERVYDADDVKTKLEKAVQVDKDIDEKINSMKATLMEKENCVMNLQSLKPNLDTANNLLQDIMKLIESLKECEIGDLDTESKEGELYTELTELQANHSELKSTRAEMAEKRKTNQIERQQRKTVIEKTLRDLDENEKLYRKQIETASSVVEELKPLIPRYEQEVPKRLNRIHGLEEEYVVKMDTFDDAVLKRVSALQKKIEELFQSGGKKK